MGMLSYVRMVLWSFFGIRRRAAAGAELEKVKPLALVAIALVLASVFGLSLWAMASGAVHSLSN